MLRARAPVRRALCLRARWDCVAEVAALLLPGGLTPPIIFPVQIGRVGGLRSIKAICSTVFKAKPGKMEKLLKNSFSVFLHQQHF